MPDQYRFIRFFEELGIGDVLLSATRSIRSGDTVTVSCAEGEIGKVYAEAIPFEVRTTDLSGLERPVTQIMLDRAHVGLQDE